MESLVDKVIKYFKSKSIQVLTTLVSVYEIHAMIVKCDINNVIPEKDKYKV